jgi:hypothetical protein
MAEGWLCARRTLRILDISANKWQVDLPPEATSILERTHTKWGSWGSWDQATSPSTSDDSSPMATSATFQPSTGPGRFSAGPSQYSLTRHTDPSSLPTNPVTMVGPASLNPQHASTPSVPLSFLPRQAVHPSLAPQAQRPEFAPPEPTYLRPSVTYRFPAMTVNAPSPSSPRQTWYDGAGTQMPPQNTTPASTASPVSGYDGTDNLVEESQDWWSRNVAVYNSMGMDGWGGAWNSPGQGQGQGQSAQIHYRNGNVGPVHQPSVPGPRPEQQSRVSVSVSALESPVDSKSPGYEDRWT